MTTKHTPTPWGLNTIATYIQDVDGAHIAKTTDGYYEDQRSENAAFIVKAVNCHDEWKSDFIQLHNILETFGDCETCREAKRIVTNALAKAKGDA